MAYTIQKYFTKHRDRKWDFPFSQLRVGESFTVPRGDPAAICYGTDGNWYGAPCIATAAMYRFNRYEWSVRGKEGAKLSYRSLPDGSVMIGRIE